MKTLDTHNKDKPNLLFIDDEVRILRSMRLMFRRTHNVYTTTEPHEFRSLLREHDMSVVICDQRMPKVTGTQLLKEVSEVSPASMRILLTGYADLNAVIDAINQGQIYRYITKPWNSDELKQVIDDATRISQASKGSTEAIAQQLSVIPHRKDDAQPGVMVMFENEVIYQRLYQQFGSDYQFFWAKDVNTTMETLEHNPISIVICDVHFCDREIVPVINALKKITPDIMTLVITTHQDSGTLIRLINEGQIFRCMTRPVKQDQLKEAMQLALQQHEALLHHPEMGARFGVEELGGSEAGAAHKGQDDFIDAELEAARAEEAGAAEKTADKNIANPFARLIKRIRAGFS